MTITLGEFCSLTEGLPIDLKENLEILQLIHESCNADDSGKPVEITDDYKKLLKQLKGAIKGSDSEGSDSGGADGKAGKNGNKKGKRTSEEEADILDDASIESMVSSTGDGDRRR